MEDLRSYITGMLLSFITWEAWENVILSIFIALIGGFAAAAGKQCHQWIYERRQRKIKEKEENESNIDKTK